ncbi:MAG TPA: 16S rRNA (cytidine(1402)-2'-O)-methyltransferase [Gemmatimonadaceae bacterium]|nr:16S rRNA (cytidine(1402)-2'-O)-methyltransferase [Gemmatimonadaceae bacterium]
MNEAVAGRLFVVSTPIGNMGDLTYRAVEVLRSVSLVLAEDTRHSRPLLQRYDVEVPLAPYHEHNEARATPRIVDRLQRGEDVALISDAGTPLLSDPGARLVKSAIEAGIEVVPVPGASALLAALVGSGLDATRFTFFGFLPRKGRERRQALDEIARLRHTAVLYEAPARVAGSLGELAAMGGAARQGVVARELTKQFEEYRRGTVDELAAYYRESPPRGEVVIVIAAGAVEAPAEEDIRSRVQSLRAEGSSAREITRTLVEEMQVPRNVAYRLAHEP